MLMQMDHNPTQIYGVPPGTFEMVSHGVSGLADQTEYQSNQISQIQDALGQLYNNIVNLPEGATKQDLMNRYNSAAMVNANLINSSSVTDDDISNEWARVNNLAQLLGQSGVSFPQYQPTPSTPSADVQNYPQTYPCPPGTSGPDGRAFFDVPFNTTPAQARAIGATVCKSPAGAAGGSRGAGGSGSGSGGGGATGGGSSSIWDEIGTIIGGIGQGAPGVASAGQMFMRSPPVQKPKTPPVVYSPRPPSTPWGSYLLLGGAVIAVGFVAFKMMKKK